MICGFNMYFQFPFSNYVLYWPPAAQEPSNMLEPLSKN